MTVVDVYLLLDLQFGLLIMEVNIRLKMGYINTTDMYQNEVQ